MSHSGPCLEMRQISKRFPGVQALDSVSIDLRRGEVHALVGENGAGKSTLVKILCGVYEPDEGQILLDGAPVVIHEPRQAQQLGISIVHQELSLFPNLSVAENILGGRMPTRGLLALEDWRRAERTAREYMEKLDLAVDPRTPVERLSIGQQQVVEIAKALAQQARILILDEPTSSLTEHETDLLFRIVDRLRQDGLSVIHISHRLEEVFEIADRVTVLRDGQLVDTRAVTDTDLQSVIRMMVGRQMNLQDLYGPGAAARGPVLLEVEHLCSAGRFSDVSFRLHAGEILGMAGLIGAGRTDVGLALFGAAPVTGGSIRIDGTPQMIDSPHAAMARGIAYLSEDRHSDGLFFGLSVRENISVTHLDRFARLTFVDQGQEAAETRRYVDDLNIQTPGLEQAVFCLSGGNQQKVILARWLAIEPRILIVDEPTRGIDVGSKQEIYSLLHRLAAGGVGIILISSEMPEILGMSDRVLVMHEGRLAGELSRTEATEERIMLLAAGQRLDEPIRCE